MEELRNYPQELLIAEKERLEIAAKKENDYVDKTSILRVITEQYESSIKALDNLTSSSRIMDSPLHISHEQAKLIVSLLPKWTKEPVPKMADPTMYGTATEEGDGMIVKEIRQIFGKDYL